MDPKWNDIVHKRHKNEYTVKLTLLAAEVFREGGAVTDMRPPPPRTGDLLSSLAEIEQENS